MNNEKWISESSVEVAAEILDLVNHFTGSSQELLTKVALLVDDYGQSEYDAASANFDNEIWSD